MNTAILHWVFLMPALMAVSFVAILFFGKRMPRKGSEIGIAAVGVCFLFAVLSGLSVGMIHPHLSQVNNPETFPADQF